MMSDLMSGLGLGQFGLPSLAAQQAQAQNLWGALGIQQAQGYSGAPYEAIAKLERETFYRSCSKNWLNAMLDVELGV